MNIIDIQPYTSHTTLNNGKRILYSKGINPNTFNFIHFLLYITNIPID